MFPFAAFRFLAPFIRIERRAYLLGVILILVTSLLHVLVPWLVGKAIHILEVGEELTRVPEIALVMVGVVLLRGVTSFWTRQTVIGASRRIEKRVRDHLFRHIEKLDGSFYAETHTGDLMSRFTSDMDAMRMVFGPAVMYSVQTVFTIVLTGSLMLSINPSLTLYSLVPLAFLTVAIRVIGPKVHRESMIAQERLADISVHAQENFSNPRVVKSFVVEDEEIERMARLSHSYFGQNMRIARLRAFTGSLLWLFGDLALITLVLLGGLRILRGELDLGEFATFNGCQLLLVWPMIALGWVMNLFHRGAASAERVRRIFEAIPAIDDSAAVAGQTVTSGSLSFDRVGFKYPGAREPAIEEISFDIRGGGTLGIVGPTASGKTTLLNLIPRLSPLSTGSIRVDGHSSESYPLDELRSNIGLVQQEAFLFSATIAENIAFGADSTSSDAIEEAARLVRIHGEIERFPDGFQQRVGERGITLSGGQKQRIALARALITRPRILILDDVLSAVDAETEVEILEGLEEWTRDLTTVIVSHRLSAVRHADEIIVLDEGRIADRGNHDQLMARGGDYARIYLKQTLQEELEGLE